MNDTSLPVPETGTQHRRWSSPAADPATDRDEKFAASFAGDVPPASRVHGRCASAVGCRRAQRRGDRPRLAHQAQLIPARHRRPHVPPPAQRSMADEPAPPSSRCRAVTPSICRSPERWPTSSPKHASRRSAFLDRCRARATTVQEQHKARSLLLNSPPIRETTGGSSKRARDIRVAFGTPPALVTGMDTTAPSRAPPGESTQSREPTLAATGEPLSCCPKS
jgi:hypothetical protein